MQWNSRGYFFFNYRNCSINGLGVDHRQKPVWWLHNRHWTWINRATCMYWMFWIGGLHWGSQWADFVIFEKWPFAISQNFSPFWHKQTFFQISYLSRNIKAYVCLNMNNFDGVDFSEHCWEEVIHFFWCSVYLYITLEILLIGEL